MTLAVTRGMSLAVSSALGVTLAVTAALRMTLAFAVPAMTLAIPSSLQMGLAVAILALTAASSAMLVDLVAGICWPSPRATRCPPARRASIRCMAAAIAALTLRVFIIAMRNV